MRHRSYLCGLREDLFISLFKRKKAIFIETRLLQLKAEIDRIEAFSSWSSLTYIIVYNVFFLWRILTLLAYHKEKCLEKF